MAERSDRDPSCKGLVRQWRKVPADRPRQLHQEQLGRPTELLGRWTNAFRSRILRRAPRLASDTQRSRITHQPAGSSGMLLDKGPPRPADDQRGHMPYGPDYLDYSGRDDTLSGGVRTIPVSTANATYKVWTKRVGNNPATKLLLLHGGPGATHEYFECFDSYPVSYTHLTLPTNREV